jgi:alkanesulfonate monooxygenase SsuD/methylene tetrahydromethanopterin reductase-like flavin-dependent oxidoreductase (luciferase family)
VRDLLEAIQLADRVGLDAFGIGEHHTRGMPMSSPTSIINAAAASTEQIILSTTVNVLSTDEPIRVFQQLATAAAVAPGRIEAVAGRGSSAITFPLFDEDEADYDMLYLSKLGLLLEIDRSDPVTWSGPHRRRPLEGATIVPRPESPLPIWLGTGGSPESVGRAVELGLPMFLGILGGTPEHWARYGDAYRGAWREVHDTEPADVAVAMHGFVSEDDAKAKETFLRYEHRMFVEALGEMGRPAPSAESRAAQYGPDGMVFVGGPEQMADRIIGLHGLLGHRRHIIQMDVGGMPQAEYLRAIELLGTEVLPRVRAAIG